MIIKERRADRREQKVKIREQRGERRERTADVREERTGSKEEKGGAYSEMATRSSRSVTEPAPVPNRNQVRLSS